MKNLICFELNGLNIDRFLSELEKQKIEMFDICKNAKSNIKISILSKNYSKFVKLCNLFNIKYVSISESGWLVWFNKFVLRLGIVVGVVCAIFFVWASSCFVWNVDIFVDGNNENYESVVVEDFLKSKGVVCGTKTNNIDCDELEREIVAQFKNLTSVVVKKEGVNLFVYANKVFEAETNNQKPIIASVDGVIDAIDISVGVAKVCVGDVVKKGQVLVEPFNGVCKADVFLKTWLFESETKMIDVPVLKRTGNTKTKSEIVWGNLNKELKCDFEFYEVETTQTVLFYNLFLPLKVVKQTFYELQYENEVENIEEIKQSIKHNLCSKLESLNIEDFKTQNVSYSFYQEANTIRGVASFEVVIKMT